MLKFMLRELRCGGSGNNCFLIVNSYKYTTIYVNLNYVYTFLSFLILHTYTQQKFEMHSENNNSKQLKRKLKLF